MKKILIVDDQKELRDLVDITLKNGDYEILHAESGDQALEIIHRHSPDLVIMDVVMPGKTDGISATRKIKSDPRNRHIHIVILTSQAHPENREQGLLAGADDYLIKPFSPLKLMEKVENLLGKD